LTLNEGLSPDFGQAPAQLWLFWVAPLLGAGAAGIVYRLLWEKPSR
jgi:glycerol uptake facilitator-like aquaporin